MLPKTIENMQNVKTYILFICCCCSLLVHAEEGMWIPTAIPDTLFDLIDEAGSDITADDIYHPQNISLKDQVVYLSNGHSGVIVSKDGLLLTNYTPFIRFIEQTDSLTEGFAADGIQQEIPLGNLYALQLKRTENISNRIYSQIDSTLDENHRKKQIDSICSQIYLEQPNIPGHLIQIECNSNQEYHLYEYAQYNDIRLVYLPHQNMATYRPGNQLPQRYVADFCLLRIYTSRDNTPSMYSEFNIPAQDMPHATLSRIKKQVADPVFYLGYPNFSERYLLSEELKERWANDSAKIMVWQFLEHQHQAKTQAWQDSVKREQQILKRLQLIEKKQEKEMAFTYWAANHQQFETALRYGNLLPFLQNSYTARRNHLIQYRINVELFKQVNSIQMGQLLLQMNAQNEAATLSQIGQLFKKLNIADEKAWLSAALDYYRSVCDTTYLPHFYELIDKKYKGDTQKYVDYVLKKSFMVDEKRFTKYLDAPTEKQRLADPLLQLCTQISQLERLHYLLYIEHDPFIERSKRMYQEAIAMQSNRLPLPEANYTLRLGYGHILGYHIGNGIQVDAFATLNRLNNQSYLYDSPPMVLDSSMAQSLLTDTIYTDFYTTCDAPYGRMGEAVYNAHGELLGIISGVNPEGKYNTYAYDSTYQRTQVCDLEYLVFLLEHSNADYLIDEFTFGEPEQLVQIEYIDTPVPLPRPDSILLKDSTWVILTDSLLKDSTFVAQYDSLLRTYSWYNDSTLITLTDSIMPNDSTSMAPISEQ